MSESVSLTVTGMKCGGCESNVKNKLSSLEGVVLVQASSKDKKVDVDYNPQLTNPEAISLVIKEAGYSVE